MKLNKTRTVAATLYAIAIFSLTACGGGGGDKGNETPSNPPPVVVVVPPVVTPPVVVETPPVAVPPTEVPPIVPPVTPPPVVIEEPPVVPTQPPVIPAVPDLPYSATDSQITAYVKLSNIDYSPKLNGRPSGTWRWHNTVVQPISVYIPAPSNTQEQSYFEAINAALVLMNTKLNGTLVLKATSSPALANHIQISYNTSFIPQGFAEHSGGEYCANVSSAPNSGNPIVPSWDNAVATNPVYINVGNRQCTVTQDIIVHEFGHALGLTNHFKGFGIEGVISEQYWDTLFTLYNNPPSTTESGIAVKRAPRTLK